MIVVGRAVALVALLAWAGCGAEDVELASGDAAPDAEPNPGPECQVCTGDTCVPAADGTACSSGVCVGGQCSGSAGCESGARFVAVAAGQDHTCALGLGGTLYCWGLNADGQLGLGDVMPRLAPEPVGTDVDWDIVAAGWKHSCGQRRDNSVWCWGKNNEGQLGVGDTAPRTVASAVAGGEAWTSIDGGENHTCALGDQGSLWCWGANADGQLGNDSTTKELSPIEVSPPMVSWREQSVGGKHTCAVDFDGGLWCWGLNDRGQVGIGGLVSQQVPQPVTSTVVWSHVGAGGRHTCAIDSGGVLYCWGRNTDGELGVLDVPMGVDPDRVDVPIEVAGTTRWSAVELGDRHTCAIAQDGTLWCWGRNDGGQLGIGDTAKRAQPVQLSAASDWAQVSAGKRHTCALRTNGALFCWGLNDDGQLGLDDLGRRTLPSQVCPAGGVQ